MTIGKNKGQALCGGIQISLCGSFLASSKKTDASFFLIENKIERKNFRLVPKFFICFFPRKSYNV